MWVKYIVYNLKSAQKMKNKLFSKEITEELWLLGIVVWVTVKKTFIKEKDAKRAVGKWLLCSFWLKNPSSNNPIAGATLFWL